MTKFIRFFFHLYSLFFVCSIRTIIRNLVWGRGVWKIVDSEGREECHMDISVIKVGIIEIKCVITYTVRVCIFRLMYVYICIFIYKKISEFVENMRVFQNFEGRKAGLTDFIAGYGHIFHVFFLQYKKNKSYSIDLPDELINDFTACRKTAALFGVKKHLERTHVGRR